MDTNELVNEVVGHSVEINIKALLDDGGGWIAEGHARFGATQNGQDWGHLEYSTKSFDDDPNSAIATVMLALSRIVSVESFQQELIDAIQPGEGRS